MDPAFVQSVPMLLYAIFIGAAALSITVGALLTYHWFRYAMNPAISMTALIVYASVTTVLIFALLGATIMIASSL